MAKSPAADPKRSDDAGDRLDETDLANELMGDNKLQGNDQGNVRNQRQAVPDVKDEADDVVESFEKLDPKVRAECDSGKK